MAETIFIPSASSSAPVTTDPQWQTIIVPLPSGDAIDLPGPAPGFLRFYDSIASTPVDATDQTSDASVELVNTVTLDSWVLPLLYTVTYTLVSPVLSPIHSDEVVRVTSLASPALPNIISANYRDVPETELNLVLVRFLVDATDQIAIPAPAAGLFRRWYMWEASREDWLTQGILLGPTAQLTNGTGTSGFVDWKLGGATFTRTEFSDYFAGTVPPTPANRVCVTNASGDLTVTSADAEISFIGAYETLSE